MKASIGHLRALRLIAVVAIFAMSGCVTPASPASRSLSAVEPQTAAPTRGPAGVAAPSSAWGSLPLYFVPNQGQADPLIDFSVTERGATTYFTPAGVTFAVTARPGEDVAHYWRDAVPGDTDDAPRRRWVVKVDFLGADPSVQPVGIDQTDAIVSYFKGSPEQWKAGIPTYGGVGYHDLWPGVDLIYSSEQGHLKYSLVLQPGADPRQIALGYRGAEDVRLAEDGGLDVRTPLGRIHEGVPVTYQEIDGQRVDVGSAFVLQSDADLGTSVVGFDVASYDPSQPLIIDPPVFVYVGYIGGTNPNGFDGATGIKVDDFGNAYIGGATTSTEATFPVAVGPDLTFAGSADGFVAKVRADGTGLVYAGYIGGTQRDDALAIAIDGDGNAYLAGQTFSAEGAGFPLTTGAFDVTHNGQADAFVTKINKTGTGISYSTYVGGSQNETALGIAVDPGCESNCAVYVTGETGSSNLFPAGLTGTDATFNGGESGGLPIDAFVFKLNAAGNALIYGGYIGGAANDTAREIAVDAAGSAYIIGNTNSTETTFPNGGGMVALAVPGFDQTANGGTDAYVAKLKPDGSGFAYLTYLGGGNSDNGINMGIAVDSAGSAYVAGDTIQVSGSQAPFPAAVGPVLTLAGSSDVFITKLNPAGTALVYSGFIGGSQGETVGGVVVDSLGNAYVTGRTSSSVAQGFPAANGPDLTFGGNADAFVAKVRPDGGGFGYVTYLGGTNLDEAQAIALDTGGNVYLTGDAGSSETQQFPVAVGPDLTFNGGGADVFVAKLGIAADLSISVADAPDPVSAGLPLTYTLAVRNNGPDDALGVKVNDSLPSGTTLVVATPAQGTCTGASVVVCDIGGLANGVSTTVQITVVPSASGTITNNVSVSSLTSDPTPANNTATAQTTVNAVADLATTLSIVPDPGIVGGALTYAVKVTNNGPSMATGVAATVTWPNIVTFGSAAPSQGSCNAGPGQVTCNLGSLATGTTASIAIAVTPNVAATITTTAAASSPVTDPNAANNAVSINTNIVSASASPADLALSLTDSPDPVDLGSPVTYVATVRNNGPATAGNVQLTATLPDGSVFGSATASQGSCTNVGVTVSCALGAINSGSTTSVTISATPNVTGAIALTASVTSSAPDLALGNNTAAQGTIVNAAPSSPGPPVPTTCGPRPNVRLTVVPGGPGRLSVTVTSGANPGASSAVLRELRFGAATNGLIDIPGGQTGLTGNATVPLATGTTQTTFVVRQASAGAAVTVPLTVADECGDFPTFVGGGPNAFQ